MSMWGEDIKSRLLFFSRVGTKLTGHTIELSQYNWTKQKDYPEFKKHLIDISPITYIYNRTGEVPSTLLVHARSDNQVPYSNAVRLKSALEDTFISHKLITPAGSADNHNLGGVLYTKGSSVIYDNQTWVYEAKSWIEQYVQ